MEEHFLSCDVITAFRFWYLENKIDALFITIHKTKYNYNILFCTIYSYNCIRMVRNDNWNRVYQNPWNHMYVAHFSQLRFWYAIGVTPVQCFWIAWPRLGTGTRSHFINILWARFLYKSELSSFSLITFGFAIFWCQNIGKKIAFKMLMALTPCWRSSYKDLHCLLKFQIY